MKSFVLKNATYLDVEKVEFLKADILVKNGKFAGIGEFTGKNEIDCTKMTIVPSFIDGHIHLESSVVNPSEFAEVVSAHGTGAVVTDPHEIANVLGKKGIDYMLAATKNLPIDVYFMVPSCVPATCFDESGGEIDAKTIKKFVKNKRFLGLAEMMNFVGVVNGDEEVLKKIEVSKKSGKVIDGHAPGLSGEALAKYVDAGIGSDHECSATSEAREKLALGQYIMIREGTACKNLKELLPILKTEDWQKCMFVCDDKHPDQLIKEGHIDYIVKKAIDGGVEPSVAYTVAAYNPTKYFGLAHCGAIKEGYAADFIMLSNVKNVKIKEVYKAGRPLREFEQKVPKISKNLLKEVFNTVHLDKVKASDFDTKGKAKKVIGLVKHEILTTDEGEAKVIDISRDILKVCVIERHNNTGHIGIAFIKGYGLKSGAVATSVMHDSHNIIAVGASDEAIAKAVNKIIAMQGGMVVVDNDGVKAELALRIAGIMTETDIEECSEALGRLEKEARNLGVSEGIAPFMTLSFVGLPVIPKLKLTTKGVVDVDAFRLLG